jgi:hypothetical protein
MLLGLEERAPPAAPDDHTAKPRTLSMHGHPPNAPRLNVRRAGVVAERAALTLGSVAVSVFVPEFSAMMAFIGSFAAFLLCIIGASVVGGAGTMLTTSVCRAAAREAYHLLQPHELRLLLRRHGRRDGGLGHWGRILDRRLVLNMTTIHLFLADDTLSWIHDVRRICYDVIDTA